MSEENLSPEAKQVLITVARNAIQKKVSGKTMKVDTSLDELQNTNGAFVTLHKKGALRGCIGVFRGDGPLHQTVASMAVSAAFEDPRFPPVTADELGDIDLEISVLTPLRPIKSLDEIEVGKHGLYIVKDFNRGVLLPQVATEYGWDRETFLNHTCIKAGLPSDCWKRDAEIYTFSADIFSE